MRVPSVAGPLARGVLVVVSAWRDVQEGARADLLVLPGICRVDVKTLADSFLLRFVNDPAVELHSLPAGEVQSFHLTSAPTDGPALQVFDQQHAAFRAVAAGRTIDVSVIVGIMHLRDHGIARVSAQAILSDA
jgi:hypothetical protein